MKEVTLSQPNGTKVTVPLNADLQTHFGQWQNYGTTIVKQINEGMYSRFFAGKKGLTVYDFGANIGLFSLYVSGACKKLYCIEPTKTHMDKLKELLKFGSSEEVAYLECALTSADGTFNFILDSSNTTTNRITDGKGTVEVEGKCLSSIIKQKADFVKVDIEGGEMDGLQECEIKAVKSMVEAFFVEVHPTHHGSQEENLQTLTKRFEKCGYKVERINFETIYCIKP